MASNTAPVLIELGCIIIALALLARAASRVGIPAVPLYLLAGLAFGKGGLVPLVTAQGFTEAGAEIGLILLMFMLGLEHSARELVTGLRSSAPVGLADAILNFVPGMAAGLLLGWTPMAAAFLGGVTFVSSSGIAARLLSGIHGPVPEAPAIVSILILEDLGMAVYLPVVAALLAEGLGPAGLLPAAIAIGAVVLMLLLALKVETGISRMLFSSSDEGLLLTILGIALAVAGLAESIQVSAAVGALLVGILLSGPAAAGAATLLSPLRDLFAAIFFAFIGLSIDPRAIPPVLGVALALAAVTALTKLAVGWLVTRRSGISLADRLRAGSILVARAEFSLVIGGLAISSRVEPDLGPLTVAYAMILAVAGPLATHLLPALARRAAQPQRDPPGV
jgi:CPA2 family monovalent cation:H+ antiporter-2